MAFNRIDHFAVEFYSSVSRFSGRPSARVRLFVGDISNEVGELLFYPDGLTALPHPAIQPNHLVLHFYLSQLPVLLESLRTESDNSYIFEFGPENSGFAIGYEITGMAAPYPG